MPSSSLSRLPQIRATLAASLLAVALFGGAGASAQSRTALQPPADSAKLPPGPGAHGPGSSLPAGAVESADGKRSAWVSEQLYRTGMFHGSLMQGTKSVERAGRNGCSATLEALPHAQLFTDNPRPAFLFDPVLLDAAGQVVAYWFWEAIEKGTDLFPYRVGAFHCYAPAPPTGTLLECRAVRRFQYELKSVVATQAGEWSGGRSQNFYSATFKRSEICGKGAGPANSILDFAVAYKNGGECGERRVMQDSPEMRFLLVK